MDLITSSIFSVRLAAGERRRVSLPEAYALLVADAVEAFTALRPHQAPAWHAFLVQLGALALHHAGQDELPADAETWAALLRALAGADADTAFALVVEDWTKPAFMQPPAPSKAAAAEYKLSAETPDALDLLVTSKDHDVKAERMGSPEPEHWAYALVTLQTFEGVMGSGKYGIARMNGGYGSRPMLGVVPEGGPGVSLQRDLVRLLAARDSMLADFAGLGTRRAVGLTWLEAWDGAAPLAPEDLDPFFIEVCRRVRFVQRGERLVAFGVGSKAARIAWPKDLKGRTGDPWAPVDRQEGKVLSVTRDGFGYRRMAQLLDPALYDRPPLARIDAQDAKRGLSLRAVALARGQGKTEGFHRRAIPIEERVRPIFARGAASFDRFGTEARRRADKAGEFGRKALRPALFLLFQGGEKIDFQKPTTGPQVEPWMRRYDARVDAIFFDQLFQFMAAEDDEARRDEAEADWQKTLRGAALAVLRAAEAAAPRKAVAVYRARAAARSYLAAKIRHELPLSGPPRPAASEEQPDAPR
ncbi:CRISPR system Cascade subunit CasA [Methylobacterium sp. 174MFSha1.1]|uniref:type I-E CRISPR-associated protein Cse1/CasA n=1 Tax=Methylobacterium sp. 174MFSha1.1 TaxID=1502749 RepID=UPI0008E3D356|nr:type I-E CRISPR-associated protein Cse1/CasA [Methylobacterium sp. 174MFSha1.1]SFU70637.1 CRISPR system Cascade subunit CasA [Methylobacterium sp. 174MFSha1.1]